MANSPIHDLLTFDLGERDPPTDDVWLRVTRGELSPADAVAERRVLDGADEQLLHQRFALYAPASEQARAESLERLLAKFFSEPGESAQPGSDAETDGAARAVESVSPSEVAPPEQTAGASEDQSASEAAEDPQAGRVIDLSARRRRAVTAAVFAVAAAVLLTWVLVPRGPQGEPMPGFAPEWSNQYTGTMRGVEDAGECQRYKSDGRLLVRLRPEVAVTDDLVIAALARPEEGEPVRLAIDPTISADGVIVIDQSVDALGLTPGQWTVSFFLSRGAQLSLQELAELSVDEHPEIAVITSRVCIE